MRCLPPLAALLACSAFAFADPVPVPVSLTVAAGSVSDTFFETDEGQALLTVEFSGVLEGAVTLDPLTAVPVGFAFTGGSLVYSDGVSTYEPNVFPQQEDLVFTRAGVMGPLTTLVPQGAVDPVTGALNNADHVQNLTSGTLQTDYRRLVFGSWITLFTDTRDYATQPESVAISGTTSLVASTVNSGVLRDRLRLELIHLGDTTPQVYPVGAASLTVTGSGGFSAIGEIDVPAAGLRAWWRDGGREDEVDENDPSLVAYALGYPPGTRVVPVVMDPAESVARGGRDSAHASSRETATPAPASATASPRCSPRVIQAMATPIRSASKARKRAPASARRCRRRAEGNANVSMKEGP